MTRRRRSRSKQRSFPSSRGFCIVSSSTLAKARARRRGGRSTSGCGRNGSRAFFSQPLVSPSPCRRLWWHQTHSDTRSSRTDTRIRTGSGNRSDGSRDRVHSAASLRTPESAERVLDFGAANSDSSAASSRDRVHRSASLRTPERAERVLDFWASSSDGSSPAISLAPPARTSTPKQKNTPPKRRHTDPKRVTIDPKQTGSKKSVAPKQTVPKQENPAPNEGKIVSKRETTVSEQENSPSKQDTTASKPKNSAPNKDVTVKLENTVPKQKNTALKGEDTVPKQGNSGRGRVTKSGKPSRWDVHGKPSCWDVHGKPSRWDVRVKRSCSEPVANSAEQIELPSSAGTPPVSAQSGQEDQSEEPTSHASPLSTSSPALEEPTSHASPLSTSSSALDDRTQRESQDISDSDGAKDELKFSGSVQNPQDEIEQITKRLLSLKNALTNPGSATSSPFTSPVKPSPLKSSLSYSNETDAFSTPRLKENRRRRNSDRREGRRISRDTSSRDRASRGTSSRDSSFSSPHQPGFQDRNPFSPRDLPREQRPVPGRRRFIDRRSVAPRGRPGERRLFPVQQQSFISRVSNSGRQLLRHIVTRRQALGRAPIASQVQPPRRPFIARTFRKGGLTRGRVYRGGLARGLNFQRGVERRRLPLDHVQVSDVEQVSRGNLRSRQAATLRSRAAGQRVVHRVPQVKVPAPKQTRSSSESNACKESTRAGQQLDASRVFPTQSCTEETIAEAVKLIHYPPGTTQPPPRQTQTLNKKTGSQSLLNRCPVQQKDDKGQKNSAHSNKDTPKPVGTPELHESSDGDPPVWETQTRKIFVKKQRSKKIAEDPISDRKSDGQSQTAANDQHSQKSEDDSVCKPFADENLPQPSEQAQDARRVYLKKGESRETKDCRSDTDSVCSQDPKQVITDNSNKDSIWKESGQHYDDLSSPVSTSSVTSTFSFNSTHEFTLQDPPQKASTSLHSDDAFRKILLADEFSLRSLSLKCFEGDKGASKGADLDSCCVEALEESEAGGEQGCIASDDRNCWKEPAKRVNETDTVSKLKSLSLHVEYPESKRYTGSSAISGCQKQQRQKPLLDVDCSDRSDVASSPLTSPVQDYLQSSALPRPKGFGFYKDSLKKKFLPRSTSSSSERDKLKALFSVKRIRSQIPAEKKFTSQPKVPSSTVQVVSLKSSALAALQKSYTLTETTYSEISRIHRSKSITAEDLHKEGLSVQKVQSLKTSSLAALQRSYSEPATLEDSQDAVDSVFRESEEPTHLEPQSSTPEDSATVVKMPRGDEHCSLLRPRGQATRVNESDNLLLSGGTPLRSDQLIDDEDILREIDSCLDDSKPGEMEVNRRVYAAAGTVNSSSGCMHTGVKGGVGQMPNPPDPSTFAASSKLQSDLQQTHKDLADQEQSGGQAGEFIDLTLDDSQEDAAANDKTLGNTGVIDMHSVQAQPKTKGTCTSLVDYNLSTTNESDSSVCASQSMILVPDNLSGSSESDPSLCNSTNVGKPKVAEQLKLTPDDLQGFRSNLFKSQQFRSRTLTPRVDTMLNVETDKQASKLTLPGTGETEIEISLNIDVDEMDASVIEHMGGHVHVQHVDVSLVEEAEAGEGSSQTGVSSSSFQQENDCDFLTASFSITVPKDHSVEIAVKSVDLECLADAWHSKSKDFIAEARHLKSRDCNGQPRQAITTAGPKPDQQRIAADTPSNVQYVGQNVKHLGEKLFEEENDHPVPMEVEEIPEIASTRLVPVDKEPSSDAQSSKGTSFQASVKGISEPPKGQSVACNDALDHPKKGCLDAEQVHGRQEQVEVSRKGISAQLVKPGGQVSPDGAGTLCEPSENANMQLPGPCLHSTTVECKSIVLAGEHTDTNTIPDKAANAADPVASKLARDQSVDENNVVNATGILASISRSTTSAPGGDNSQETSHTVADGDNSQEASHTVADGDDHWRESDTEVEKTEECSPELQVENNLVQDCAFTYDEVEGSLIRPDSHMDDLVLMRGTDSETTDTVLMPEEQGAMTAPGEASHRNELQETLLDASSASNMSTENELLHDEASNERVESNIPVVFELDSDCRVKSGVSLKRLTKLDRDCDVAAVVPRLMECNVVCERLPAMPATTAMLLPSVADQSCMSSPLTAAVSEEQGKVREVADIMTTAMPVPVRRSLQRNERPKLDSFASGSEEDDMLQLSEGESSDELSDGPDFLENPTSSTRPPPASPTSVSFEQETKTTELASTLDPSQFQSASTLQRTTTFSLDSLLQDKKRNDAVEKEIKDMQEELRAGILKGGIEALEEEAEQDEGSNDDFTTEQRDCLSQLRMDQHQIAEYHPGEMVLKPEWCGRLFTESLTPVRCGFTNTKGTRLERLLDRLQPAHVIDILSSGVIPMTFRSLPSKEPVLQWLMFLASVHSKSLVVLKCIDQITEILQLQLEGIMGKHTWSPPIQDMIRLFTNWGASFQELDLGPFRNSEAPPRDDAPPLLQPPRVYKGNIQAVLQILSACLQSRPSYSTPELTQLLLMVCRLALDTSFCSMSLLYEFQVCVASILECYSASQWHTTVPSMCRLLSRLTDHHHNQLYLTQLLPASSQRSIFLRQRLAFILLHAALRRDVRLTDETISNFQLREVVVLVPKLKALLDVDLYRLSSLVQLVDMCVGSAFMRFSQQKQLYELIEVVRYMISDMRDNVRKLDVIRVKDVLVRMCSKWDLALKSCSIRQRKIFACYSTQESPAKMETLQASIDDNDDDSFDDEDENSQPVDDDDDEDIDDEAGRLSPPFVKAELSFDSEMSPHVPASTAAVDSLAGCTYKGVRERLEREADADADDTMSAKRMRTDVETLASNQGLWPREEDDDEEDEDSLPEL